MRHTPPPRIPRPVHSAETAPFLAAGLAAVAAGAFYAARGVVALLERRLDHAFHAAGPSDWVSGVVPLLMLAALVGASVQAADRRARLGLSVGAAGLAWVTAARTFEMAGVSAPWGLYSSPGLVLFLAGLAVAGAALTRTPPFRTYGRLLLAIGLLRFGAGLTSIVLYNALGRGLNANWTATLSSHAFHLVEAACWVALGVVLARGGGGRVVTARVSAAPRSPLTS